MSLQDIIQLIVVVAAGYGVYGLLKPKARPSAVETEEDKEIKRQTDLIATQELAIAEQRKKYEDKKKAFADAQIESLAKVTSEASPTELSSEVVKEELEKVDALMEEVIHDVETSSQTDISEEKEEELKKEVKLVLTPEQQKRYQDIRAAIAARLKS